MRNEENTDFFAARRPRVMAHRGFSAEYPENTMLAFRAAVEAGADYIELDVHCTRDGQVVVFHDSDFSRIASDDRLIEQMTMAEIEAIDAAHNFSTVHGSWPFRGQGIRAPTLLEVLSTWPTIRFVIEFKPRDSAIAEAAIEVVRRARMERQVLFASEHLTPIAHARKLAPEIPTNLAASEIVAFVQSLTSGAAYHPIGDALQIPPEHDGFKLATPEVVAAAHRNGLEVHVWTINDRPEMEQMLSLGVDGIMTDHPSRLLDLIHSRRAEA
ncbi:MAG TPA: glycerophosphodiester phosphodiesterase [Candidatus Binataceae bacterium]|nr:glycerophosphodiester phosphodiesterase [Candidatus Binataceae bacterium]